MKKRFSVEGMSCSACKMHVEKALKKVSLEANVNLVGNYVDVIFDCDEKLLFEEVEKSGYKLKEYKIVKEKKGYKKIIISVILLLILMYVSMYHMLKLPMFNFIKQNHGIIGCYIQMILALIIIIINKRFYISGFKKLIKLMPNMDSLVFLGSIMSFIYALINLILLQVNINNDLASHYQMNLYFESAAMILVFVSIGKHIEGVSKNQTKKALEELMDLIPKEVLKKVGDEFILTNIEEIEESDILQIKPYEFVGIDSLVIEGESLFDESSITGESKFVYKSINDEILSGSINQGNLITVKALRKSNESTISKVINLVEEASNSKMPLARIADKVSKYFTPAIIILSLLTFIIWFIISKDFEKSFNFSISVMVISCPCALGLATPLCIMISSGLAAKKNILIKSAEVYENMYKINTIVIDKTGTVTEGKTSISDIYGDTSYLDIIKALENGSNHPFSRAFDKSNLRATDIKTEIGYGINGIVNDKLYYVGGIKYLNKLNVKNDILEYDKLIKERKNVIFLFDESKIYLCIALIDKIKENSKKAIKLFKKNNIDIIMASGDILEIVENVSKEVGINKFYSNMLPIDKANLIDELKLENKKVMMIGDGINDAIALTKSDISVCVDSKMSITSNTSDVILAKGDLMDCYNAFKLSRKTVNNIKLNLFWAFFYNMIGIPIAMGLFYPHLKLTPMLGSLFMSLSSVCVCLNALRLKRIKWEEDDNMKLKFCVEDMMCAKCEAHVKEALSVDGVENIKINVKKHLVEIETTKTTEEIFDLIKEAGYTPSK